MGPERFFDLMREAGWKVTVREEMVDKEEVKGTARQFTLAKYSLTRNVNGHIIGGWGDTYLVGRDLRVSCTGMVTSGLRDEVGQLEKVSDVEDEHFSWFINAARVARNIHRGQF